MNSIASAPLLHGVDYDPLLASWPPQQIDEQLMRDAPVEARYVLKAAYADRALGYTEGSEVWDNWLVLFERFGPTNTGVQIGLLGLTFIRHEARHHLDFYGTPLGWFFPVHHRWPVFTIAAADTAGAGIAGSGGNEDICNGDFRPKIEGF